MKSIATEQKTKVQELTSGKRIVAYSVIGGVGAGGFIGIMELLKDQPNWLKGGIGAILTYWLYSKVGG